MSEKIDILEELGIKDNVLKTKPAIVLASLATMCIALESILEGVFEVNIGDNRKYPIRFSILIKDLIVHIKTMEIATGVLLFICNKEAYIDIKEHLEKFGFCYTYLEQHGILVISLFGKKMLAQELPNIMYALEDNNNVH